MSSESTKPITFFLVIFAGIAFKLEKSWLNFFKFQSMSFLAIRCNSNLRVACVQTPPPLRHKNNDCVRAVQDSRVVVVFQHLFNFQRENKKRIIHANVYRNTIKDGD